MEYISFAADAYLKVLDRSDARAMYSLTNRNRSYLRQWLPWVDGVTCLEDSARFIDITIQQRHRQQGIHCGIWYKGELAGVLGVHAINWPNRRTAIGYWLGEEFQGRGLMTRAVAAYLDNLVFGRWQLNRVEIAAATENRKSRAIPERLGFRLEGILRCNEFLYDHYVDHAVYGLLASEWRTNG
ncbi:GNAT family N-acetyltransferase [Brevibacillus sp. SYP-B805]|uniref:GNAT family N-acetyltransferase n=1 Tax=Brevibacillus sp. SYP-B805 TaxID=1578199 RepID=UPI0013EA255D|nr:GNAT family protein [Brevibacillus sp. SYP-B805]NGQ95237.1 GNAT family N-acetyltransferase [Brevibacillus sp. SYP-B805]